MDELEKIEEKVDTLTDKVMDRIRNYSTRLSDARSSLTEILLGENTPDNNEENEEMADDILGEISVMESSTKNDVYESKDELSDTSREKKIIRYSLQALPSYMKFAIYQQSEPQNLGEAPQRASNTELAKTYDSEDGKKDNNKAMMLVVEKLEALSKAVTEGTAAKPPVAYMAERAPVNNQGRIGKPRNNNNYRNGYNNNPFDQSESNNQSETTRLEG